jgi:diacylglycerol kinase (ATP)
MFSRHRFYHQTKLGLKFQQVCRGKIPGNWQLCVEADKMNSNVSENGLNPRSACLLYNPASGRYPSRLLAERAADLLRKKGWKVHLEQSVGGPHITEVAARSAQDGFDVLFIVGGDGSINYAVAGLIHSNTALGVLPAGTANVWAQELGLAKLSYTRWTALEESAKSLSEGVFHHVDLGVCNGRPFLLWAGVGLDGYIVHHIEPRTRLEKNLANLHYGVSAVWYASQWHGMNMHVAVDGKMVEGHFLLNLASNIHLYAGGIFNLPSDSFMDDGVMDLWLLEGDNMGDTIQRAWELFSGRDKQSGLIRRLQFSTIAFQSESDMYVQLDGEPVLINGNVKIEVLPRALRILSPKSTPRHLFLQKEASIA